MAAARKEHALSALSCFPILQHLNGSAFYHDDYTGELIASRVGFPGILVKGSRCPESERTVIFGAFKNVNVAARFVLDYAADMGADLSTACMSWLKSFAGCDIVPAPSRNCLQILGGRLTLDAYHKEYPVANTPLVEAAADEKFRHEAEEKKKHEREEARAVRAAQADEYSPKNFNLSSYIKKEASPDAISRFTVICFPALNIWYVKRHGVTSTPNKVEFGTEERLGVQLPWSSGNSSELKLEPDITALTKGQKALVKKFSSSPEVKPKPKPKKRTEGEHPERKHKKVKKVKTEQAMECAESGQCP